MKKLVIVGAGGHGKVIADIAVRNGFHDIIFLDDNELIKSCVGFPVVDKIYNAELYSDREFIVAIGNNAVRKETQERLKNLNFVTLVHPAATIGRFVTIGEGTVVMANAVINSESKIGAGCIINTSSSIDHDCTIGNYSHICPGVRIAGNVVMGENSWIGIGASVINDIIVGDNVFVGAGAVVVSDLLKTGQYVGIPARLRKGIDLQ